LFLWEKKKKKEREEKNSESPGVAELRSSLVQILSTFSFLSEEKKRGKEGGKKKRGNPALPSLPRACRFPLYFSLHPSSREKERRGRKKKGEKKKKKGGGGKREMALASALDNRVSNVPTGREKKKKEERGRERGVKAGWLAQSRPGPSIPLSISTPSWEGKEKKGKKKEKKGRRVS